MPFSSSSFKCCSSPSNASPLRTSIPSATLFSSESGVVSISPNFVTSAMGRLSTQKYPISSNIFNAVDFPAPDIPVTITNLICTSPNLNLLKLPDPSYFRFQPYAELRFHTVRHLLHQ